VPLLMTIMGSSSSADATSASLSLLHLLAALFVAPPLMALFLVNLLVALPLTVIILAALFYLPVVLLLVSVLPSLL